MNLTNSGTLSHTHWQAPQAGTQTKACQRVCLSHLEKKKLKIFPSKNFKTTNTQPGSEAFRQFVTKLNIDNGCKTQTTRTPGHNSVFATIAGDVGKSTIVHIINFCASGQVSAPKPLQRKYANR